MTAAECFESTDIPLMAVVRGITEIPARSLEVTANYACILATGKRCDGSDPTPEDLESGYYSLMPGGGKGVREVTGNAKDARKLLGITSKGKQFESNPSPFQVPYHPFDSVGIDDFVGHWSIQ